MYRADLGAGTTDQLIKLIKEKLLPQSAQPSWEQICDFLQTEIAAIMGNVSAKPLNTPEKGPLVILVVGVNGVGKTTSIGKLAAYFKSEGKSVLLCAADTFRAAAIEQLQAWGQRLNVDVIKHQAGSDPAAVAYDAVKAATARDIDVVIIDTAGRLHNKLELMDELGKIKRIIGRDIPEAPHETLLVLDATTGQNAVMQVKAFSEVVPVTGLIVTKLDGTAKGGVIVGISEKYHLPIRFIGIGEKAEDLRPFSAADFAGSIL